MKDYEVFVYRNQFGNAYSYKKLVAYYDKEFGGNKVSEKKGFITYDIAKLMVDNGARISCYDSIDTDKQKEYKDFVYKMFGKN